MSLFCFSLTKKKKQDYQYVYNDGILISKSECSNGVLHGPTFYYYSNRKICLSIKYENGILSGESIGYYPDGNIHSIGQYENNVRVGLHKIYDRKGNLLITYDYNNYEELLTPKTIVKNRIREILNREKN